MTTTTNSSVADERAIETAIDTMQAEEGYADMLAHPERVVNAPDLFSPPTFRRQRHIERDVRDYSLRALVDELRTEARVSWGVMHDFRRKAVSAQTSEDRCMYLRLESGVRQQLARTLSVLNAGLGRDGSFRATSYRRLLRDVEARS